MDILEQLALQTKERVKNSMELISADEMKYMALSMQDDTFDFEIALSKKGLSFIAECKKAMPVIGTVAVGTHFVETASELENAGADCISVVTEPKWFLGCRDHLRLIVNEVSVPCLRKEAVVDEYMIYESKIMGAKAVLLIPSLLTDDELRSYIQVCDSLGISAFIETCCEKDIKRSLNAGARIIVVDNRDLRDFSIDPERCLRLRDSVPSDVIYVAEGGIATPEQIKRLRAADVDAVIIGEALMRAANRTEKLNELRAKV